MIHVDRDIILEYNRATELVIKGNFKKALPILRKVLRQCEFKEAYINIGNCYRGLGMHAQILPSYLSAVSDEIPCLDAKDTSAMIHALNNLGLEYYALGDDLLACKTLLRAIKLNDKAWEAWWNYSTATLRRASSGFDSKYWERGWEAYDARFLKNPPVKVKNNRPDLMYWDTTSIGGDIVVLVEQGLGDSFMWGRYLGVLAGMFSKVYVQCPEILSDMFTRAGFYPVRDAIDIESSALVAYPMCSLAKVINGGVPIAGDWLRGKYEAFGPEKFNGKIVDKKKLNVGIVWSGNPTHLNDANRSINIGRFSRLAKYVNLFSLSPGFSSTKYVTSLNIKTWTDTASAICGLDLVLGVDTSVMHMCGSLGVEGWLMQPSRETDFRWGNGVSKCAWYSSIRIFENPGSWEKTFDNVEAALIKFIADKEKSAIIEQINIIEQDMLCVA
jgi:tetratricopeptide (TPR) repeat protein